MRNTNKSLFLILLLLWLPARADHHGWEVAEVFSNSDGSLQFVEFFSPSGNHPNLTDFVVTSTAVSSNTSVSFTFPNGLSGTTENRSLLLATAGFESKFGIAPDYVIPDGFLVAGNGSVSFNNTGSWAQLPDTGRSLNFFSGTVLEDFPTPENFAGETRILDLNAPDLTAVPTIPLVITSNSSLPIADPRITDFLAPIGCSDEQDLSPNLSNDLSGVLLTDTTVTVTITCSDAGGNSSVASVSIQVISFADQDGDGIADESDPDDDGDGVDDIEDAFPQDAAETVDTDSDGIGDNADSDDDNDGSPDNVDDFPKNPAESVDTDGDGEGNNSDTDDDGDGVSDLLDQFPLDASEAADTDADGVGNNTDTDDDNDGIEDAADAFPLDATESLDNDRDGVGNNTDTDDDNDGVADVDDAFPLDPTRSAVDTVDTDGDGEADITDTDDDNDGVPDSQDVFPLDPGESEDTDYDGTGNNSDEDDDGDSLPDDYELANGLDPLTSEDAAADSDSDGVSNLNEFINGSNPQEDDYAPVISLLPTLRIPGAGPLTGLPLDAATAVDGLDTEVAVSATPPGPFTSGTHQLTWTAIDDAGNQATAEQLLEIKPILLMEQDLLVTEGNSVQLNYQLTGPAINYPLSIPLIIQGTANSDDYDFSPTIDLSTGESGLMTFTAVSDGISEGDESAVVSILQSDEVVAGSLAVTTITITEALPAHSVNLKVRQGDEYRRQISLAGGAVEITAVVANGSAPQLSWQGSDDELGIDAETGSSVMLDLASLQAGQYTVQVAVTVDARVVTDRIGLTIRAELEALNGQADTDGDGESDATEGRGDADEDGIPDYLDNSEIAEELPVSNQVMRTQPGLKLQLGETAIGLGLSDAGLAVEEFRAAAMLANRADPGYQVSGTLYDFRVRDLAFPGQTVKVVLPFNGGLPAGAQYRKYSVMSGWQSFQLIGNDEVASAQAVGDICPLPGSDIYGAGLLAGHDCIQLTLTDGGVNDADGEANQKIADPGAVAVVDSPPVLTLPMAMTFEADNSNGIAVQDTGLLTEARCDDVEDGDILVTLLIDDLPADGTTQLSLGQHELLFRCEDSGESVVTDGYDVMITDTTAPVLTVPLRLDIEADSVLWSSDSRIAAFAAAASCEDLVGGSLPVTNNLPSEIGYGAISVTFVCVDDSGNEVSDSALLVLREPAVTLTGEDSGAGCFVATAAYGSYLSTEVVALRQYRDNVLLKFGAGQQFVELYYRYSPAAAAWIAERGWAQFLSRTLLTPVVYVVLYPLTSLLLALGILLGLIFYRSSGDSRYG